MRETTLLWASTEQVDQPLNHARLHLHVENLRNREYHIPHHADSSAVSSIQLIELNGLSCWLGHLKIENTVSRNQSVQVLKERDRVLKTFNYPTLWGVEINPVATPRSH
jgi:hypothetical protein